MSNSDIKQDCLLMCMCVPSHRGNNKSKLNIKHRYLQAFIQFVCIDYYLRSAEPSLPFGRHCRPSLSLQHIFKTANNRQRKSQRSCTQFMYDAIADVAEMKAQYRSDFQSGSRDFLICMAYWVVPGESPCPEGSKYVRQRGVESL